MTITLNACETEDVVEEVWLEEMRRYDQYLR